MILGRNQLNRWPQVLMYALGNGPGVTHPSPLTILASTRARFMELICTELDDGSTGQSERAFMVGTLSLTEALLEFRWNKRSHHYHWRPKSEKPCYCGPVGLGS